MPGTIEAATRDVDSIELLQVQADVKLRVTDCALDRVTFSSLVVVSNRYGLVCFGTESGFVVATCSDTVRATLQADKAALTDQIVLNERSQTVTLSGHVVSMALSSDEQRLIVVTSEPKLLLFALSDVLKQGSAVSPAGAYSIPGEPKVVCPNPHALPDSCAVLLVDSSLYLVGMRDGSIKKFGDHVASIDWSPKGKQIACGMQDGTIQTRRPDGSLAKTVPMPSDLEEGFLVNSIKWFENEHFAVQYRPTNLEENADCFLYIIHNAKGARIYHKMDDPCFPIRDCESQVFWLYLSGLAGADHVLFFCSSQSETMGVIAHNKDSGDWETWNLPEGKSAVLPLTADSEDTFPLGLALNTTSCDPFRSSNPDQGLIPAAPILFIMTTEGVVIAYHVVDVQVAASGQPSTLMTQLSRIADTTAGGSSGNTPTSFTPHSSASSLSGVGSKDGLFASKQVPVASNLITPKVDQPFGAKASGSAPDAEKQGFSHRSQGVKSVAFGANLAAAPFANPVQLTPTPSVPFATAPVSVSLDASREPTTAFASLEGSQRQDAFDDYREAVAEEEDEAANEQGPFSDIPELADESDEREAELVLVRMAEKVAESVQQDLDKFGKASGSLGSLSIDGLKITSLATASSLLMKRCTAIQCTLDSLGPQEHRLSSQHQHTRRSVSETRHHFNWQKTHNGQADPNRETELGPEFVQLRSQLVAKVRYIQTAIGKIPAMIANDLQAPVGDHVGKLRHGVVSPTSWIAVCKTIHQITLTTLAVLQQATALQRRITAAPTESLRYEGCSQVAPDHYADHAEAVGARHPGRTPGDAFVPDEGISRRPPVSHQVAQGSGTFSTEQLDADVSYWGHLLSCTTRSSRVGVGHVSSFSKASPATYLDEVVAQARKELQSRSKHSDASSNQQAKVVRAAEFLSGKVPSGKLDVHGPTGLAAPLSTGNATAASEKRTTDPAESQPPSFGFLVKHASNNSTQQTDSMMHRETNVTSGFAASGKPPLFDAPASFGEDKKSATSVQAVPKPMTSLPMPFPPFSSASAPVGKEPSALNSLFPSKPALTLSSRLDQSSFGAQNPEPADSDTTKPPRLEAETAPATPQIVREEPGVVASATVDTSQKESSFNAPSDDAVLKLSSKALSAPPPPPPVKVTVAPPKPGFVTSQTIPKFAGFGNAAVKPDSKAPLTFVLPAKQPATEVPKLFGSPADAAYVSKAKDTTTAQGSLFGTSMPPLTNPFGASTSKAAPTSFSFASFSNPAAKKPTDSEALGSGVKSAQSSVKPDPSSAKETPFKPPSQESSAPSEQTSSEIIASEKSLSSTSRSSSVTTTKIVPAPVLSLPEQKSDVPSMSQPSVATGTATVPASSQEPIESALAAAPTSSQNIVELDPAARPFASTPSNVKPALSPKPVSETPKAHTLIVDPASTPAADAAGNVPVPTGDAAAPAAVPAANGPAENDTDDMDLNMEGLGGFGSAISTPSNHFGTFGQPSSAFGSAFGNTLSKPAATAFGSRTPNPPDGKGSPTAFNRSGGSGPEPGFAFSSSSLAPSAFGSGQASGFGAFGASSTQARSSQSQSSHNAFRPASTAFGAAIGAPSAFGSNTSLGGSTFGATAPVGFTSHSGPIGHSMAAQTGAAFGQSAFGMSAGGFGVTSSGANTPSPSAMGSSFGASHSGFGTSGFGTTNALGAMAASLSASKGSVFGSGTLGTTTFGSFSAAANQGASSVLDSNASAPTSFGAAAQAPAFGSNSNFGSSSAGSMPPAFTQYRG
ncbi:hypothetical protein CXG81DRAFT_20919 [Caulochytrium protostelioides]|uniref:Nucleoporin Nup159/Nup146 N-terminal domain-containing protein n=1 Tax=Caulochytrium protostelioides TaxID=1555241 RepID=A0A4P9X1J0_9FUNG|nr:hypothetical protein CAUPRSCDRAFT_10636 [Caulochytrium protostelioides]RKO98943.1 hypothetical protein CXG81DRAFT_20919 [Caulochytrium protostelioides]|eukprot:RKO98943.1 hypothetical protein CXG81DRAFT_20919 [Caulochytrium protostelioides]